MLIAAHRPLCLGGLQPDGGSFIEYSVAPGFQIVREGRCEPTMRWLMVLIVPVCLNELRGDLTPLPI